MRGLLSPDGPKSVQPIAARLGLRGHDQLHHFISSPTREDPPLWRVLAGREDAIVGGDDAVLVVDDTALPKKGTHSVASRRNTVASSASRRIANRWCR